MELVLLGRLVCDLYLVTEATLVVTGIDGESVWRWLTRGAE